MEKKETTKKKKKFPCHKCEKKFKGASGLWYHNKHVHKAITRSIPRDKRKNNDTERGSPKKKVKLNDTERGSPKKKVKLDDTKRSPPKKKVKSDDEFIEKWIDSMLEEVDNNFSETDLKNIKFF